MPIIKPLELCLSNHELPLRERLRAESKYQLEQKLRELLHLADSDNIPVEQIGIHRIMQTRDYAFYHMMAQALTVKQIALCKSNDRMHYTKLIDLGNQENWWCFFLIGEEPTQKFIKNYKNYYHIQRK